MPKVDIIIVNWNAGDQLRACLQSIEAASWSCFTLERVVVVDNASADGSLEGLASLHLPLILLRNGTNRGFAAACNQGAAGSTANYLLFLNPDTRIQEDTLDCSVRFLEQPEHERIGLLGVQLIDDAGNVSRTCARFPTPARLLSKMTGLDQIAPQHFPGLVMTQWDHLDSREVDHVMGSYFFTRRALFEALRGFDEGFFVYLEDVDYAWRARKAGWRTYYLTDTRVYHRGCGTSEQVKAHRLTYALQSRILYGYRHFHWLPATALALGTLSAEFLARLSCALLRRSRREWMDTLAAYRMLGRNLRALPGKKTG